MKIKVKIKSRLNYLAMEVDTAKEICKINDEKYDVNADSVALRLYAYTFNWPENIKNRNILDGEKYKVTIKSDKDEKVFIGENAFPTNYKDFKKYIYDIQKGKKVLSEVE